MPATAVKAVLALAPCTIRQQQKAAIRLIYKGLCQSIFVGKNASNSSQSCKFLGTIGSMTTVLKLPQGSVTMVQVTAFLSKKRQQQRSKFYLPWHLWLLHNSNRAELRIIYNGAGHSMFLGTNAIKRSPR